MPLYAEGKNGPSGASSCNSFIKLGFLKITLLALVLLFAGGRARAQNWNLSGNASISPADKLGSINPDNMRIVPHDSLRIFITGLGGNVGIGTDKVSGYRLSVEGAIRARKVRVYPGTWSDSVFAEDFVLMPANELETYLSHNHHLPNVPSEAIVKESGIETTEMFNALLKEVEILNLRLLGIQKEFDALKQKSGANHR